MAEDNNNIQGSSGKLMVVTTKGLHTDYNEEFQPEGTYRYALNASLESDSGEMGAISNYKGNVECLNLTDYGISNDYVLVGAGNINSNQILLVFTNGTTTVIGRQFECEFTVLIRTNCMNLSTCNHVDIIYKLQNGCDHIVNFTDGVNRYHSINLSNLARYVTPGRDLDTANTLINGEYGWDCSQFYISPDYQYPDIELEGITTNGQLPVGSYKFAVRYLDNKYNETSFATLSQPVYIVISDSDNSTDISNSTGGIFGLVDNNSFIRTNKAITLNIKNLDLRYKYIQVAIVISANQSDVVTDVRLSEVIPISESFTKYTLIDFSNLVSTSLNETMISDFKINVVQAHTRHQDRLILGNVANPDYNWVDYQKIANEIKVLFVETDGHQDSLNNCDYKYSDKTTSDSTREINYSSPKLSFDNKGYMRDEIYSFGIVFVFKNGNESAVMHIPGRPKLGVPNGNNTVNSITLFNGSTITPSIARSSWDTQKYLYNSNSDLNWDDIDYVVSGNRFHLFTNSSTSSDFQQVVIPQAENIYKNLGCNDMSIPRWKHVNTGVNLGSAVDIEATNSLPTRKKKYYHVNKYLPGYFETDTVYPDSKDCNGVPVFPHDVVVDNGTTSYVMHNIRHHRVPDARLSPIYKAISGDDFQGNLHVMLPFFYNINIPANIKENLQGYYIVRSDRAGNKTVIDKGWMNVCDTTHGFDGADYNNVVGSPYDSNKYLESNQFFLSLSVKDYLNLAKSKPGDKNYKIMNVVEFVSPKTIINEPVNLPFNHFKLENTTYGDRLVIYRKKDLSGSVKLGLGAYNIYHKQARIGEDDPNTVIPFAWRYGSIHPSNVANSEYYSLAETIPVVSKEYALYDQNNLSLLENSFINKNDDYKQLVGMAKIFDIDKKDYTPANIPRLHPPRAYANISLSGTLNSGVSSVDAYWSTRQSIWDLARAAESAPSGKPNDWLPGDDVDGFATRGNIAPYMYYVGLKSDITPYRRLENIRYLNTTNYIIDVNETSVVVGGGDIFLTIVHYLKSYINDKDRDEALNYSKYIGSLLSGIVESEINLNYRHKERGDTYAAYPFQSGIKVSAGDLDDIVEGHKDRIEQLYKYDLDYSDDTNERVFYSLNDAYEYCADCRERFPRVSYYSEVSLPDQVNDLNRKFLVNSTINVGDDITNLFVKEDNLFIHTKGNLFRVNTGAQEMQTNSDTIQLGAADLSSARLQKLFDNKSGIDRGGCNYKFSGSFCLDNYIWVDDSSNRVYSLNQQVKEISSLGMRKWFSKNLELRLQSQYQEKYFELTGNRRDYPYVGTTCNKSIGFISTFDPEHRLYILTKKDYVIPKALYDNITFLPDSNFEPGRIYIDDYGFYYGVTEDSYEQLGDAIPRLLEYNCFTISYSLDFEAWVSFHSFIPNLYYNSDMTYYSFITDINAVFKHNDINYQTYYYEKFDYSLELIFKENPYAEMTYDNFEYVSNVLRYDPDNKYFYEADNVTFDRFYVYNNNQVSELREIVPGDRNPYSRIIYNTNQSQAYRNRNVWRVSRFRDMAINRPSESMFTSDFAVPTYSFQFNNGRGWVDKVINPGFINVGKSVYQMARFTDKFLGVRLFFKNLTNYKIVTNLFSSLKRNKV